MDSTLFWRGTLNFILSFSVTVFLLFLPAGTFEYWNGLLFMHIIFIPMFLTGITLMIKNPELLRKRLNSKEEQPEQKIIIIASALLYTLAFVMAGLNFRFNWITMPSWISYAASITFLLGYGLFLKVLIKNEYLSRTVEIQENQKVIDTGVYGVVRHPMYSAIMILFLSMPLILGSVISFIIFLLYPIIISKRIKNEEKVLEEGLAGYSEYKKKVKYKVIPFIW